MYLYNRLTGIGNRILQLQTHMQLYKVHSTCQRTPFLLECSIVPTYPAYREYHSWREISWIHCHMLIRIVFCIVKCAHRQVGSLWSEQQLRHADIAQGPIYTLWWRWSISRWDFNTLFSGYRIECYFTATGRGIQRIGHWYFPIFDKSFLYGRKKMFISSKVRIHNYFPHLRK